MIFDTLVIASGNKGKIAELDAMLAPLGIVVQPAAAYDALPPFPPEDGDSYRANALIKAHHVYTNTKQASLADDSGIEVVALDNIPGIYSARYGDMGSDAERNDYLLEQLSNKLEQHPERTRAARFVCGLALVLPDGVEHYFEGVCEGIILEAPVQSDYGFGYDPLFFSPELDKTFAEATKEEKARVSHRGRALQQMIEWLQTNS